ncbi:DUF5326 family protein [Streptomyces sp. NPDC090022]|uniref:DUF5326 family protein n=1 Tax=Streptomyces sp. NPDC090022 TaxID=3365920 RepID=UPI0037F63D16
MREIFAGMPWWVKWVAVPLLALFVFGGLITALVGFVFKALLFVALVAGLIFVVKRFTGGGSAKSSGSGW